LTSVPEPRTDPEWEEAATGLTYKILAADRANDRISLLVRLAPGAEYPPHRHAGLEELYLLDGELWIDDTKLYPGEYNWAEGGSIDQRIWSEIGCTCVLLTSTRDVLR
jgi:anti-sigma factor ChrR (cupin superfamily)